MMADWAGGQGRRRAADALLGSTRLQQVMTMTQQQVYIGMRSQGSVILSSLVAGLGVKSVIRKAGDRVSPEARRGGLCSAVRRCDVAG